MSRRVYLLGVGVTLVALALAITDWALNLRPGVTEANTRRIRPGTTVAEAERLLGGPAQTAGRLDRCGDEWSRTWVGPSGTVHVLSCPDGRILHAQFQPNRNEPPFLLTRLRVWLGW